jgi:ribosomal protein L28
MLVLYQWEYLNETSSPKVWENVELVDGSGKRLWRVNGMNCCRHWSKNRNTFVSIRKNARPIHLVTFSGNVFELDLDSRYVKYVEFSK